MHNDIASASTCVVVLPLASCPWTLASQVPERECWRMGARTALQYLRSCSLHILLQTIEILLTRVQ